MGYVSSSLSPFIFSMVFNACLFEMDEVIKLPNIKAGLEELVIAQLTTQLSRVLLLKKVTLLFSLDYLLCRVKQKYLSIKLRNCS